MNIAQRIFSIILAAVYVAAAILILSSPELGYLPVVLLLAASLILTGIRSLIYYFTMARHMVGGRISLYVAVLTLDLGAFSIAMADAAPVYIVLYLFATHAFSGGVDIMRALEAKKYRAKSWRFRLISGIINIAVAFACLIFMRYTEVFVWIFALGLIYVAVQKLINAFRRTSVVYIQ